MNTNELIELLDQQFGNPKAPKRYLIIQEAVKQLQLLNDDNQAMRQQIADLVANRLEEKV